MNSGLWNNITYKNKEISFLVSSYIFEYDISKANINILYFYNKIDKKTYDYLSNCPRLERQKTIGIMELKDVEIKKIIADGIIHFKKELFESNNIKDSEVLSIKNDAVFLLNHPLKITKFNNIEFKLKNVYSSFYRINNLEIYYYYSEMNNEERIDIKGINKEILKIHEKYFLEFLLVVFESAQVEEISETIKIINSLYDKYVKLELEPNYYRTFDYRSLFMINKMSRIYEYGVPFINKEDLKYIDISFNLNIIRQLLSYYYSMTSNNYKR